MYLKKPGYKKVIIKNLYTVWIPPVPEKHKIQGWELKKEDQFWQRKPIPEWYHERRKEEAEIQAEEKKLVESGDLDKVRYFDPQCEEYRREEWRRRVYGHWFMNNGKPVYITGLHYFYLQWCELDVGYPTFYMSQVKRFYFRQLCWEDPFCLGYFIAGPRGFGKSAEETAAQLENITKAPAKRFAAIQSKNSKDAEVLFTEKMVPMFNGLPHFFKPEFSHGSNPRGGFNLTRLRVTGKDAKDVQYGPEYELSSTVTHYSAKDKALDNKTLCDTIQDEIGKLEPDEGDITKRMGFVIKAVYRNDAKVGIIRGTSTIEEMKKGGEKALIIWTGSDPNERDRNGYTTSKLYKYFVSALETKVKFVDKYGYIDEDKARKEVMGDWKAVENDPDEYASRRRKDPLSEDDMFIKDQSETPFPVVIINDTINNIQEELRKKNIGREVKTRELGRKGNLEYISGKLDTDVMWVDDPNGLFTVYNMPEAYRGTRKVLNNCRFVSDGDKKLWLPCNDDLFTGGCDPRRWRRTKDKRSSKMAAYGIWRYDPLVDSVDKPLSEWLSQSISWKYHGRSLDPNDDYENIIKALRYFGHRIAPEANVSDFTKHIWDRGYWKYMITRKDFDTKVLAGKSKNPLSKENAVDNTTEVGEALIKRTIRFLILHGIRIKDLELMEQFRKFDISNPHPYDLVIAFGYAMLAMEHRINYNYVHLTDTTGEPETYFPVFDASGLQSKPMERFSDDDDDLDEDIQSSINKAYYGSF